MHNILKLKFYKWKLWLVSGSGISLCEVIVHTCDMDGWRDGRNENTEGRRCGRAREQANNYAQT